MDNGTQIRIRARPTPEPESPALHHAALVRAVPGAGGSFEAAAPGDDPGKTGEPIPGSLPRRQLG